MEVLNHYLFQHRRISIPGMGTLYMDRVPARTDFVNRQLLAPGFAFRFDKYFDAPDKEFFAYLSSKMQLPDVEAIRWYNEYAYGLRAKIRSKQEARWDGLGSFHADDNADIFFEAFPQVLPVKKPVPAVRVIREHTEHAILVGDRERSSTEMPELLEEGVHVERASWWTWALIIAALAGCICFYQFYRYGFTLSSTGNSQTVPAVQMPATSTNK
ncbi:MAG TPA: hypothetical protein PLQ65_02935 [Flavihumibacter sp.]|nr:hypothetical protein [Flavihumibacter sp.]HQD08590.1 hypothetical protein [Flavihumibacter sp.]